MERGTRSRISGSREPSARPSRAGPAGWALLLVALLLAAPIGAEPAANAPEAEASSELPFAPGESLAAAEPASSRLFTVWQAPHRDLEDRVERTIRAGHQMGIESLEAPARALLLDESFGPAHERATAAVRLAPELPAAHAALARARRADGDWTGAIGSLERAVRATGIHPDAALWAEASLLAMASQLLALSGLLFLCLAAATALPGLVSQLAAWQEALPPASWLAVLGCVVLLPALLGEGAVGLAVAATVIAATRVSFAHRAALAVASTAVLLGIFPVAQRAADSVSVLGSNHVARAAVSVERGNASGGELARVRYASGTETLAARAAALHAKRADRLDEARARFALLLEDGTPDVVNNAANVALAQGRTEDAIALYERSSQATASPVVLFNLSQAYGAAVRIDAQDLALAEAQAIDPDRVRELTIDFSKGRTAAVADMPLPLSAARGRLTDPAGAAALGRAARTRLAPGLLGASPLVAGAAMLGAIVLGSAGAAVLRRSGARGRSRGRSVAGTDARNRMERLAARKERRALLRGVQRSVAGVVPGAAGLLWGRPLLGLAAALSATAGFVLVFGRPSAPDPLAVGVLPDLLVPFGVGAALLLYGLLTLLAWRLGREA